MVKYTEEMKEWLTVNVPCDTCYQETLNKFKEKFNVETNLKAFRSALKRFGIKNGNTGYFDKNHTPWNKGTKGVIKKNKTSFKKGNKPHTWRPIGSERVEKDGYTLVKVSDKDSQRERWEFKHRLIWEREYGEIPKGSVLIFLDKNKKNFNLNNLCLVSRKELAVINKKNKLSNFREISKTKVLLSKLELKLSEVKNEKSKKEEEVDDDGK